VSSPCPDPERDTLALRHQEPEGPSRTAAWRSPGATLSLALGAGLLLAATAAVADPLTIRGIPEVLDGRRMLVAGRDVVLADIEVPALGTPCRIRGNPLDCGRLARAGLMDIVAGGDVACSAVGHGQHRCFAGRYDVAFGLIHAGWAVPTENAPSHYNVKMTQAEERGRGLWSAQPAPTSPSRRD
jgi:endonuclease YncB( thermonuclease family)